MLVNPEINDVDKKKTGDEIEYIVVLTDAHKELISSKGISLESLVVEGGDVALNGVVSQYDYKNILMPGNIVLDSLKLSTNHSCDYLYTSVYYSVDLEDTKRIHNELRAGEHFLSTADTTMINELPYEFMIIDKVIVMTIKKSFKDILPNIRTLPVRSKICSDILSYVLSEVDEDIVLQSRLYLQLIKNINKK